MTAQTKWNAYSMRHKQIIRKTDPFAFGQVNCVLHFLLFNVLFHLLSVCILSFIQSSCMHIVINSFSRVHLTVIAMHVFEQSSNSDRANTKRVRKNESSNIIIWMMHKTCIFDDMKIKYFNICWNFYKTTIRID